MREKVVYLASLPNVEIPDLDVTSAKFITAAVKLVEAKMGRKAWKSWIVILVYPKI